MKSDFIPYLRRSDRRALLFLLLLLIISGVLIFGLDGKPESNALTDADSLAARRGGDGWCYGRYGRRDSSRARTYYYNEGGAYDSDNAMHVERFPFDPNTADSTQLLRLGLRPWQVRNIYKYRAHGGIYRKPSDFARLYGLTQKEYRELEPYIRISADYQPAALLHFKDSMPRRDTVNYPVKLKPQEHIALNETDTLKLMKVPGIGRYFARQIVYYGQRLGGYHDVHQLLEIEGFPEDALSYFVEDDRPPQRLNLNKLSLNRLHRHPYISFYQARAICDYRRLKGPLHSLADLRLLKEFSPEAIKRLEPYVEF